MSDETKDTTYLKNILSFAKRFSNLDIPINDINDLEHSKDILIAMFSNAKKQVNIFESKLDKRIYGDYGHAELIGPIISFLEGNGKLTIIVYKQKANEIKKTLLHGALKHHNLLQYCEFYSMKKKVGVNRSFQTADGKAYRESLNSERGEAKANYNDPKKVGELDKDFTEFLKESRLISI